MSKIKFTGQPSDYFIQDGVNTKLKKEKFLHLVSHKTDLSSVDQSVDAFFSGYDDTVKLAISSLIYHEISSSCEDRLKNPKIFEEETKKFVNRVFIIGGVVIAIIVISLFIFFKNRPSIPKCPTDVNAFVMSQNAVKNRLRSPSTADFPYITDHGVNVIGDSKIENLTICNYTVFGYVDAQNGFGATVRNKYVVTLKYIMESDSWKAENVLIE